MPHVKRSSDYKSSKYLEHFRNYGLQVEESGGHKVGNDLSNLKVLQWEASSHSTTSTSTFPVLPKCHSEPFQSPVVNKETEVSQLIQSHFPLSCFETKITFHLGNTAQKILYHEQPRHLLS